jgi:tetratricopeptide (TPR) repeat protein
MSRFISKFVLFLLMAASAAHGQILTNQSANRSVDIRVTLSFDDGSSITGNVSTGQNQAGSGHERDTAVGQQSTEVAANLQIHVELQDSFGGNIDEKSPSGEGQVLFHVRNGGSYRIRVRGAEIEETVLDNVEPALGDRMLNIRLHRKGAKGLDSANKAIVPAKRLQAPKAALREVEKGDRALAAGDLHKARQAFEKAIELYPDYDIPYNNLGVVLMQSGDSEGGRRAFEKAIQLNDQFSRAYANLARIELAGKRYSQADDLISKAIAGDPLNAQALCLGTQSAYFSGKLDGAISYAKTLHTVSHKDCPIAHYLAGQAFATKNLPDDAIQEFELFLKEAPQDPNATKARQQIAQLKVRAQR